MEREIWRLILLTSQKNFPFKPLDKYNQIDIRGVICNRMTTEPLAAKTIKEDSKKTQ